MVLKQYTLAARGIRAAHPLRARARRCACCTVVMFAHVEAMPICGLLKSAS